MGVGASGMSSNLDAAGTITIITLLYLHGLQGFFIEMRGGVVLPIAVFLAFMGKWHMRSRVMTTGEWMLLRFGSGWQGRLARYVAAATYLVITVGMVVFFLSAAGKFLAVFLPYSETTCAVAMAVIALAYTMASGLYGVIWTDVFQAGLIGFAAIYMSVLAFGYVTPELLADWPGAASNQVWPVFFGGLETPVIEDLDAAAPALGTGSRNAHPLLALHRLPDLLGGQGPARRPRRLGRLGVHGSAFLRGQRRADGAEALHAVDGAVRLPLADGAGLRDPRDPPGDRQPRTPRRSSRRCCCRS